MAIYDASDVSYDDADYAYTGDYIGVSGDLISLLIKSPVHLYAEASSSITRSTNLLSLVTG